MGLVVVKEQASAENLNRMSGMNTLNIGERNG